MERSLTGNGSPSSRRQPQEGWKWMVGLPQLPETVGCTVCSLPPHCKLLFRSVATISRKKELE